MASIADLSMTAVPEWTAGVAGYPNSPDLVKKFTVSSRFGEPVRLWEPLQGGKMIGLPRGVCPLGDDRRAWFDPDPWKTSIKARNSEQSRFISEISGWLNAGQSGIAEAPTGFGKTVCTAQVIANVGVPTMVVVPKDDLMDYWRTDLAKLYGWKPNEIGIVQQDKYDVAGKKVVIGMLHSLAIEDRYPSWLTKAFGLVVFDEVHRLGAETFSRVCRLFSARLRLGLSATPDRQDGKEVVFYSHIGPIRFTTDLNLMVPKVLRFRTDWECPRSYARKDDGTRTLRRIPHEPGKCMHVISILAKNTARNKQIASMVFSAYQKGRDIVVFSDLLDHLDVLMAMCQAMGIPSKDMGRYVGGMKKSDLEISKGKKVKFATYKMMGEGTNIPWMDTAVLTTPRFDVEQIVGRIRREYEGKKEPVVFDVVDEDSPVFAAAAGRRSQWYRSIGAEVVRMN